MRPVWRTARAAIRRRLGQTFVIGLVVFLSAATVVLALGLLQASTAPFDRAFARVHGAHVTATYDPSVPYDSIAATGTATGVEAAAGPYGRVDAFLAGSGRGPGGQTTVVGRADPGGPVDRLDVWDGRWAQAPGEIVLAMDPPAGGLVGPSPEGPPPTSLLGSKVTTETGETLTVVGLAYSLTDTAGAWVTPEQIATMGPTGTQMLYRFTSAGTEAELTAAMNRVTAGLDPGALESADTYLAVRQEIASGPGAYLPFLMTFGVLALVIAVLIVANVVGGAVAAGLRHIGVLKAVGFTPRQVVAVYLLLVSVPAVIGSVPGAIVGDLVAQPILEEGFEGAGLGSVGISPWIVVAGMVAMPLLVLVAALIPAARAHRLPAARAISAGSVPRRARALRTHRRLSAGPLPSAVSLGLGLPLARPARTLLTLAAVVLGTTTVAFSSGLVATVTDYSAVANRTDAVQVEVRSGRPPGRTGPMVTGPQARELLASLPDAENVVAYVPMQVSLEGSAGRTTVETVHGDSSTIGFTEALIEGHWIAGPREIVVSTSAHNDHGYDVGDHLTMSLGERSVDVTVAGILMGGKSGVVYGHAGLIDDLEPDPVAAEEFTRWEVQLADGADPEAYVAAVAAADAGLTGNTDKAGGDFTLAIVGLSTVLSLILGLVAAMGVFNTVVLYTRERRRDIGMLKSIGMTPRQVRTMMLTSMTALGVLGGVLGILGGVLAHREILPIVAETAEASLPDALLRVWNPANLALLALAGVLIAVIGAFPPARAAARLPIAEVLRNE